MKPPLSYVPLLPATISLAAGIVLFRYIEWWWTILPLSLAVISLSLNRRTIAILLVYVTAGGIDMSLNTPARPTAYRNGTFRGVVEQWSEGENTRTILIKVDTAYCSAGDIVDTQPFICQAVTPSLLPAVDNGDRVTFTGKITPPTSTTDLPDEYDMESYYFLKGITAYTFLPPGKLQVVREERGIYHTLTRWRGSIRDMILRSHLNDDTARFLCAILLGEKSMIDTSTRLTFSTAGMAHVLALSGMHVAIIAVIAAIALFPLTLVSGQRLSSAVIVILLWIYAIMTGCAPSTMRAVIMGTLVTGSFMLQRSHSGGNALCAAAIVIMLLWPKSLFEAGFQLSFAAVTAILTFSGCVNRLGIRSQLTRKTIFVFGVPTAAVIGTAIPVLFYFHSFPVYFLLSNIPIAFILPFMAGGGVILLFYEALSGTTPDWILSTLDLCYDSINWVSEEVAALPGASLSGIYISGLTATAACLTLTLLGCLFCFRRKVWGYLSLSAAAMTAAIAIAGQPDYPANEYFVTRDSFHTNIVVKHDNTACLISTAKVVERDDVLTQANHRYRDYLGKRGLPPLQYATVGDELQLGGDRWYVVHDNGTHSALAKPRYMLVCRGFSGDVVKTATKLSPDTVVLSHDLHPRRLKRYAKELENAGMPVISLIDKPFHRTY